MSDTTAAADSKLTKKQRKALEFRNRAKQDPSVVEEEKLQKLKKEEEKKKAEEEAQPKKRKTRRGKKGKGLAAQLGGGPRFILFVGNLPYEITQTELMSHFKSSNPDRIRIRPDKGIAFLEFYNIHQDIQKKIDIALKQHHSILKERKINVELTVGGGGNSLTRLAKLKDKNEKLLDERRRKIDDNERLTKLKKEKAAANGAIPGVHPSRAGLIN